jgi:hypothetical protein
VSAGGGYRQDAVADLPYTPTERASDTSVCKFVNNYISCLGDDVVGENCCSFGFSFA